MSRVCLFAGFVLCIVHLETTSQAQSVSVSGPVIVPDSLGGIGFELEQYRVTLHSDDPNVKVTGFNTQFVGTLAQVQNFAFSNPPAQPTPQFEDAVPLGLDAIAQDSHFVGGLIIEDPPNLPPVEGPILNLTKPDSGLAEGLLSNLVSIDPNIQAPSLQIAQIVLAPGTVVTMTGEVFLNENEEPITLEPVRIGVPEPGSIFLILLGSMVFAHRISRKSATVASFFLVCLLLSSPVTAQSVSVSGPVIVPDSLGGIGFDLEQYRVSLHSDDPNTYVTAFSLMFHGQLAQAQLESFGQAQMSVEQRHLEGFTSEQLAQDSHLLVQQILSGCPCPGPMEGTILDTDAPGSGFAANLITYPQAIPGPLQTPSIELVQVVLAPGTKVRLTGRLAISGHPESIELPTTYIGVPEPGAIGLVLALVVLLTPSKLRSRLPQQRYPTK